MILFDSLWQPVTVLSHYLILCGSFVTLCDILWHSVTVFYTLVTFFTVCNTTTLYMTLCDTLWHYVALCGTPWHIVALRGTR
jgi:hypothetical protein